MSFLTRRDLNLDDVLTMALRVGEVNIRAMQLLDQANTGAYGHPVPTRVRVTPVKGKAILVSGHDLRDLEAILKQTEGKGINVYTHGEMLPAHGYPELKKYPHLVGNYGGAWQDQRDEFEKFPGAIVMTTNCLQRPKKSYQDRIFTSGLVAWPGVRHIADRDFTPAIEAALEAPGFDSDEPEHWTTVGFGHNAILSVADRIVDAVKQGKIRRFFLIGGCDGAKSGRNYYTDFAQSLPEDCVILTLACGKVPLQQAGLRLNRRDPAPVGRRSVQRRLFCRGGRPGAGEGFRHRPERPTLSLVLSWYEQKAVGILLSLLYLGIRNIRLGPSLPAFITPSVLDVLHDKFNIMPITTVHQDLEAILG